MQFGRSSQALTQSPLLSSFTAYGPPAFTSVKRLPVGEHHWLVKSSVVSHPFVASPVSMNEVLRFTSVTAFSVELLSQPTNPVNIYQTYLSAPEKVNGGDTVLTNTNLGKLSPVVILVPNFPYCYQPAVLLPLSVTNPYQTTNLFFQYSAASAF